MTAGAPVDSDFATVFAFAEEGGQSAGHPLDVAWTLLRSQGVARHHVRTGHTGHVKPEIGGPAYFRAELIVVLSASADQNLPVVFEGVMANAWRRVLFHLDYPLTGWGSR